MNTIEYGKEHISHFNQKKKQFFCEEKYPDANANANFMLANSTKLHIFRVRFFSISRSVSIRRTIKFKWNMVKWKYRFANSHILVLIPNKTCSKKYSFATTYKSKQKALLDSDLVCSTYSEVDTHQNRQTEWAGMVKKKIHVNVLVCVWCKKWRNHSAFQSVCFHVTFFVWSRMNYQ